MAASGTAAERRLLRQHIRDLSLSYTSDQNLDLYIPDRENTPSSPHWLPRTIVTAMVN
jgi:hypothetical protein